MRLILANSERQAYSQTFVRAHLERLPFEVIPIHGYGLRYTDAEGCPLISPPAPPNWPTRAIRRLQRMVGQSPQPALPHQAMANWFREQRADALLTEFGPVGVDLMEAADAADLPLFVHFHGFDASRRSTLDEHRESYPRLFRQARALFVVSTPMRQRLQQIGAPAHKLVLNPYGVDPDQFDGARPGEAPPAFFAVGRFTEKKAPHLTVLAFAEVVRRHPEASLTMAGNGPLLGPTRRLAAALGVEEKVSFPGVLSPGRVREAMRRCRAFVQHSLIAEDGDQEGMPVAILEAQMSGLPVISTRHAGIPEAVLHGETGLLCDEGDTTTMAQQLIEIAADPSLAARLGRSARERALRLFTMDRHIRQLADAIRTGVASE